jgi:hypothetical protein
MVAKYEEFRPRGTFKDREGNQWSCVVSINDVKRLRDLVGLDVMSAIEGKFFEAIADPILLCDALNVVCLAQIERRGLTNEQFGLLLLGDTIEQAAAAFVEGVIDFFPTQRRQILTTLWEKQTAADRKLMAAALTRIRSPQVDSLIEREIQKAVAELDAALTSGAGFTNPQEPSV